MAEINNDYMKSDVGIKWKFRGFDGKYGSVLTQKDKTEWLKSSFISFRTNAAFVKVI